MTAQRKRESSTRYQYIYHPINIQAFKQKLLAWAAGFEYACLLDSNEDTQDAYTRFDFLLGAGAKQILVCNTGTAFDNLQAFQSHTQDWLFGYLSYELKNEVEDLSSLNPASVNLPHLCFFQAEWVVYAKGHLVYIETLEEVNIEEWIAWLNTLDIDSSNYQLPQVKIQNRIDKATYLSTVNDIKNEIAQGEIYEMNFCQEFFVENFVCEPLALFQKLNNYSSAPFAAFFKMPQKYLLCASPERFLKKEGRQLISQPIKGTTKRGQTELEDEVLKENLKNSPKERAENIMIVDLVRNDLTRSSRYGSIKVEELCKVYSFKHVHHLISTITSKLKPEQIWTDAIRHAFPMGSMTGCPKIRSMELIDQYESVQRGLYSGALGYIDPQGDFDFNVVIRSMLYDQANQYLSMQIGGAITYDSEPEQEYEECLIKAKGMIDVLMGGA